MQRYASSGDRPWMNEMIVGELETLHITPKVVTEIGMGTNLRTPYTFLKSYPGLESYTAIERGEVPQDWIDQARERVGEDLWPKFNLVAGDYFMTDPPTSDLILFNNALCTTCPFPQAVFAKGLVEVAPGGTVVSREGRGRFASAADYVSGKHIYSLDMFHRIEGMGFNIRFMEDADGDVHDADYFDILDAGRERRHDTISVACHKPEDIDQTNVLSGAITLATESKAVDVSARFVPELKKPVETLINKWEGMLE